MRIAVIGAGAMGSIVGGRLAAANSDVTLIDPWPDHVAAINRHGITIVTDEKERTIRVRAVAAAEPDERFGAAIILVKSQNTAEAARLAGTLLAPSGAAVFFQNGIGNEEVIAEILGKERTIGGTLYFGGNLLRPGCVKHSNPHGGIALGPLDIRAREMARQLGDSLVAAGFEVRLEDDVLALKWQKALVNIGVNAMATLRNEPNRVAGDIPEVREAMVAICAEAIEVAKAKGVGLVGGSEPAEYVRQATDVHNYQHKSSMCVDLAAGRRTEVDVTNGAIQRFGAQLGVPTPLNTIVYTSIKRIEREKGAPV